MKQPISILPAIALRGTTILPDMIVHFDVSRERSIKAIEAAMLHDQKIFLVTQKDPEVEKPELSELYQVGTVAYIKQVVKLPHDLLRVLVEGIERAELLGLEQEEPFLKAETSAVYKVSERSDVQKHSGTFSEILHGKWKDQQRSGCADHEYYRTGRVDSPDFRECTTDLSE